MKLKLFGPILAGLILIGGSAQAAMLSLDTSAGTADFLPGTFDTSASGGLISSGAAVTIFTGPLNPPIGGLELDTAADLKIEYLGKDAGFTNIFHFGGDVFNTGSTAPGTSQTFLGVSAGIIPFLFQTSGSSDTAENGGPISTGLSIAFAALGDGSFLALFDDGGQGTDYDDMVVRVSVSQVPLPAAAWLLISAILGLVSFSRIRRSGTQTA